MFNSSRHSFHLLLLSPCFRILIYQWYHNIYGNFYNYIIKKKINNFYIALYFLYVQYFLNLKLNVKSG